MKNPPKTHEKPVFPLKCLGFSARFFPVKTSGFFQADFFHSHPDFFEDFRTQTRSNKFWKPANQAEFGCYSGRNFKAKKVMLHPKAD
jgi:hypothetical protein